MKKKGPTITVSFSLINLMLLMSVPVWADVPMDLKSPFPKTVIILRSGKIEYIEKAGLLKLEGAVLEVTKSNGSLAIVSKNQVLGVLPTRPEKIEERDVKAAKDAVAFLQKAQAQLPNEPVCSSQEIEKWEKEISSAKDFHAEQSKVQEQELENKRMDSHRKKLGMAKERAETRAIVEKKPVGTNDPNPAPKQEVAKTTWPGLNSEKTDWQEVLGKPLQEENQGEDALYVEFPWEDYRNIYILFEEEALKRIEFESLRDPFGDKETIEILEKSGIKNPQKGKTEKTGLYSSESKYTSLSDVEISYIEYRNDPAGPFLLKVENKAGGEIQSRFNLLGCKLSDVRKSETLKSIYGEPVIDTAPKEEGHELIFTGIDYYEVAATFYKKKCVKVSYMKIAQDFTVDEFKLLLEVHKPIKQGDQFQKEQVFLADDVSVYKFVTQDESEIIYAIRRNYSSPEKSGPYIVEIQKADAKRIGSEKEKIGTYFKDKLTPRRFPRVYAGHLLELAMIGLENVYQGQKASVFGDLQGVMPGSQQNQVEIFLQGLPEGFGSTNIDAWTPLGSDSMGRIGGVGSAERGRGYGLPGQNIQASPFVVCKTLSAKKLFFENRNLFAGTGEKELIVSAGELAQFQEGTVVYAPDKQSAEIRGLTDLPKGSKR